MSTERSSSAVRNLRSLFEVKGSENSSSDTRGRSTSGLTDRENSRPTSKVRASFVPVETPSVMASAEEGGLGHVLPGFKRESSAGLRRGSFSENDENGEMHLQLKKTVSQEAERRERDSKVPEAIPEHAATSAAVTPMMQPNTDRKDEAVEESPLALKTAKEPANPDKLISGAEEDPSKLQPADPANEAALSGGEALPPVVEDLREKTQEPAQAQSEHSETKAAPASAELGSAVKKAKQAESAASKPTANGKPTPISTKSTQKPATSSLKSPASQPKTPLSAKASTPSKATAPEPEEKKQPSKKASRSSLTAPTAASVARAAGQDRTVSTSSKHSPPSKAKPREGTKTIDLPSRLTAPTAASRAKHDAASGSNAPNGKASTTTRPKPQPASTRPTPRASLQPAHRPDSRASHTSKKPSAPPADGSFLERMMRPTAASASKTHEKVEAKSPPRTKPKADGHAKKVEKQPLAATAAPPALANGSAADEHAPAGMETPQTNGDSSSTNGAMEATPAFGEGETIR